MRSFLCHRKSRRQGYHVDECFTAISQVWVYTLRTSPGDACKLLDNLVNRGGASTASGSRYFEPASFSQSVHDQSKEILVKGDRSRFASKVQTVQVCRYDGKLPQTDSRMDIAKLKKLKPQPYRKNLRAVVVAISDKITYSNRAGIEKNMWIIALCDQTSTIKCTVYSHEMVRKMEAGMEEGSCILISNYILKDRNRELQLVLTDNTNICTPWK